MLLETQASQQSAKKGTQYTNFSDTERIEIGRYTAQRYYSYYTLVLVKNEGGAKIGTTRLQK